jgi:hypothetical protein
MEEMKESLPEPVYLNINYESDGNAYGVFLGL